MRPQQNHPRAGCTISVCENLVILDFINEKNTILQKISRTTLEVVTTQHKDGTEQVKKLEDSHIV